MNIDKATIIAGVLGDEKVIGIKDRDWKDHLAAKCDVDIDYFNKATSGQFCVCSREVAKSMSKAYRECLSLSDYMVPFWGPKIIYTPSIKLHRTFRDVTLKALREAKKWNKNKHFLKDKIKSVYICGGAQIYKEALDNPDLVDEMILTIIPEKYRRNVKGKEICFPTFSKEEWNLVGETNLSKEVSVLKYRRR